MKTKLISAMLIAAAWVAFSCNTNSLEPAVLQSKTVEEGTKSTGDLKALILGAYASLKGSSYYGRDYIILNEVRGINVYSRGNSGRFTVEGDLSYNSNNGYIWAASVAFRVIANANLIIHADVNSFDSNKEEAIHIQGQAYALRALVHFDLLKQYGQMNAGGTLGVPYITKYQSDDLYPRREEVGAVKTKILADLDQAYGLMNDKYFDRSKITMSRYAAKALESRVCLYFGDWQRAKDAAKTVIDSKKYTIVASQDFVSSWANSSNQNSIFELAYSATDNLGVNSIAYIYRRVSASSGYGDIRALDNVVNIFSGTDVRKRIIGQQSFETNVLRNIGKYPDIKGTNNIPLVRYEEVILNYAEALFELGDNSNATAQLNLIASNRGATPYAKVTKEDILVERQKELMFEGFIFDDLMRTKKGIPKVSEQQSKQYPISYGDPRLALPIPIGEMNSNPNMEQNKGY